MVCCPAASSSKARWESAVQSTRHESMNLFNKQTFRVLLLFLLASRSGCFVIYGGAGKNAVITGHRRPRSEIRSSSSRPLRRHLQHRFVSENARVGTRTRAKSLAVDSPGDGSSRWGRDSLRSLRSRQVRTRHLAVSLNVNTCLMYHVFPYAAYNSSSYGGHFHVSVRDCGRLRSRGRSGSIVPCMAAAVPPLTSLRKSSRAWIHVYFPKHV